MNGLDALIEKKKREDPEFENRLEIEKQKLSAAVTLHDLRKELGLTQRELAAKVGKPQSTIARIENGTINTTIDTLSDIAMKLGMKFKFEFTK